MTTIATCALCLLVASSSIVPTRSSNEYGSVIVTNKLTKQVVLIVRDARLNSEAPFVKAQLYLASPINACSSVDPPNITNVHSMDGSFEEINLLLVEGTTECDISQQFLNLKTAGYSGVIMYFKENSRYSTEIPKDFITSSLYVALVSCYDGLELKKFTKRPYHFTFQKDVTVTEKLLNFTDYVFTWFSQKTSALINWISKRISPLLETPKRCGIFILQFTLLISPLIFLTVVVKGSRRPQESYEGHHFSNTDSGSWEYYDSNSNYAGNNDSSSVADAEILKRSRDLLGVSESATRPEIETQFRRRSASYHPDRNMHLSDDERLKKEERFKEFSAAKIKLLEVVELSQ